MVWIHLLFQKKSVQDSMHFMEAQQQRLSDAMKSSRRPGWAVPERFLPSRPAGHATPRTQHPVLEVREGRREGKGVEKRVLKTLPGLLTRQHEKPVIQQGRKGVTHCGPVLICKRVGSQVNIGASESLF